MPTLCGPRLLQVLFTATVLGGWLGAVAALGANGSVGYTYDALGRLTTANYDTGVCVAYTYDANGNRTAETVMVTSPTGTGMWGCFNWGQALW